MRLAVRTLALAVAMSFGCAAGGEGDTTLDTGSDPVGELSPNDAGAADSDDRSPVLQCLSSGDGRCEYVPTTMPLLSPRAAAMPPATFEGMWDHDPADGGEMAGLCGYLIIEEPYVHVLVSESDRGRDTDPGLARSEDGRLLYFMIMLPRPGTRYDSATRSLWVYREGPMTDGDHVSVGGGVGYRQPDWPGPNVHQRWLWQANSMGPADRPC